MTDGVRLNFGYLPRSGGLADWTTCLFGEPNLLKRLQARDLMQALAIRPGMATLDVGCGSGYLTVEMARAGADATGVDVNPYVESIHVPAGLADRLRYRQASATALPFRDAGFDVVLASEVLPMFADAAPVVREMRRVIRPDGRLVVLNGTGPLCIRDAYQTGSPRLERLRAQYPGRVPADYKSYASAFQRVAGTSRDAFLSEEDVKALLLGNGFALERTSHTPRRRAGDWLAWHQFRHYLRTGLIVPQLPFLPTFAFLSALSLGDNESYSGGLIVVARPVS